MATAVVEARFRDTTLEGIREKVLAGKRLSFEDGVALTVQTRREDQHVGKAARRPLDRSEPGVALPGNDPSAHREQGDESRRHAWECIPTA